MDVDLCGQQGSPGVEQRPLALRQTDDKEFGFADLEPRLGKHVVGLVGIVKDHAADGAVDGINYGNGEDADFRLIKRRVNRSNCPTRFSTKTDCWRTVGWELPSAVVSGSISIIIREFIDLWAATKHFFARSRNALAGLTCQIRTEGSCHVGRTARRLSRRKVLTYGK